MNTNEKTEQIVWLNGLKGLCCLIIFMHHQFFVFYPSTYYGTHMKSLTESGIDTMLGTKPIGFILNGNFGVCIFIMISMFLFAGKSMKATINGRDFDLFKICLKRYIRLQFAVFFVGMLYFSVFWVTRNAGITCFPGGPEVGIVEWILHIFIYQWATNDTTIIASFWCMYIFLIGSFIALFFGRFSKKDTWYMPFVFAFIGYIAMLRDIYYLPVFIGITIADIYYFERLKQWCSFIKRIKTDIFFSKTACYIIGILFVFIGLYLGGHPSFDKPDDAILLFLDLSPESSHAVGAGFLMSGLLILPKKIFLTSKLMQFFGKISFGIYMFPVFANTFVANWVFSKVYFASSNYTLAAFSEVAVAFVVTVILAVLYTRYVESIVNKLLKKIK